MALLPGLAASAALLAGGLALARSWPGLLRPARRSLAVPLLVVLWAGTAVGIPDAAPARRLAALRADPYLLWDASVPFGSLLFDLASWPLASALGDATASTSLTLAVLGLVLLLGHALARALDFGAGTALLAQAQLALLPMTWAAVALLEGPALLSQAFALLLLVHLARRVPHLQGARDAGAACVFLVLAQMGEPGRVRETGVLVVVLSAAEVLAGEARRVGRLLTAYGFAVALVAGVLYGRSVSVLWRPGGGRPHVALALVADLGLWPLLLLVPGLRALAAAPAHARRLVLAALLAGAGEWLVSGTSALLPGVLSVVAAAGLARLFGAQASASAVQADT